MSESNLLEEVSIIDASKEIGIRRQNIYPHIKALKIEVIKKSQKAFITRESLEQIKTRIKPKNNTLKNSNTDNLVSVLKDSLKDKDLQLEDNRETIAYLKSNLSDQKEQASKLTEIISNQQKIEFINRMSALPEEKRVLLLNGVNSLSDEDKTNLMNGIEEIEADTKKTAVVTSSPFYKETWFQVLLVSMSIIGLYEYQTIILDTFNQLTS